MQKTKVVQITMINYENRMKLYLAHPISGLSGKDVFTYYDSMTARLGSLYQVLSPMVGKSYLRSEGILKAGGYENPISKNHSIYERDMWMVRQSDIVFCDFMGIEKISIGCCMELAVASQFGKHTVVVMNKDNIHNHAFILEAADIVFESIEDGFSYLSDMGYTVTSDRFTEVERD